MGDISDFLTEDGWNFSVLEEVVPDYVVQHIRSNMRYTQLQSKADKPWWTKISTGEFSVSTAWELLRQREDINEDLKKLWVTRLPFKFSFLAWRIWLGKVPVATLMHSWNSSISLNCNCCTILGIEAIDHLFLRGDTSATVWSHFSRGAGILGPTLNLKHVIRKWWTIAGNTRLKFVFQVVPIVILWFLWKRRNTILHGGSYSIGKVVWNVNDILLKVIKIRFKDKYEVNNWSFILNELNNYRVRYSFKIVRWIPPPNNWLKCNTDGASRGNPGPSSAAFCIRDHEGNLVVAKGFRLPDTTNLIAEARAIRESLQYCKENGLEQIIIESDSLAMIQFLEGNWAIPWSVVTDINYIQSLRRNFLVRVQHSFREGNTLADYFANLVFDFAGEFQFNSFLEIPSEGRKILNLDKIGTPQIRRSITG